MENRNVADMYNSLRDGFNGMENMIGGQRETIPPVAQQHPSQQQTGQPPPQNNNAFQQAQAWGMNYANPYQKQQYPPNGYGGMQQPPQFGSPFANPFVAPRVEVNDSLLEYHAKLRVKLLKIKNKMMFTIPKQILKAYFDRKNDKILIADFVRSGKQKIDIQPDSEIYKAYERQDKVAELEKIADESELEEMDKFMEFISIEEFKLARENGTLKLPTLEEFNSSIQKIMLIDFSDFIIYGVKEATGDISLSAQELINGIRKNFKAG